MNQWPRYLPAWFLLGGLAFALLLPALFTDAQEGDSAENETEEVTPSETPLVSSPSPSPSPTPAIDEEELRSRQEELNQLEAAIKELSEKNQEAASDADVAAVKLNSINIDLTSSQLQIRQLEQTAVKTEGEAKITEAKITTLEFKVNEIRARLAAAIRSLHQQNQYSIIDVLLTEKTLSELIQQQRSYRALQSRLYELIQELRSDQQALDDERQSLEIRLSQLQKIQLAEQQQRQSLAVKQQEQKQFLALKETEQARYEQKLGEAKQAREEIKNSIFRLRSLNQELKLNDVYDAARYAARLTNVRPALLLGILKVETNLGTNVGSGKFPDDMHPGSREAFLRLAKQLGIDPYTTSVSRRPTSYQGWGGAMGPAQMMPATWEGLAGRVASLMQKPVADPFNLADALVGMGIMMSDRGAADPSKEAEAVARYLAGPNWQYHLWYSQRVLAVAAEYEAGGLK